MSKKILLEGPSAAGGHMWHPFDCPDVSTGQDLIEFYEKVASLVQEKQDAISVKLDGVNLPFKLIDSNSNKYGKEFASDRGSSTGVKGALDIAGLTPENVKLRWPDQRLDPETGQMEDHGMVKNIQFLMPILNETIPLIEQELKELGAWDDPNIFFNAEFYRPGSGNVKEYPIAFVAIHNLRRFYFPEGRKARASEDLTSPQEQRLLNSMRDKMSSVFERYDFKVFTRVPMISTERADFSASLSKDLAIAIGEGEDVETKTLGQWLNSANNPRSAEVIFAGKRAGALSKKVYAAVLQSAAPDGVPLYRFIENPGDVQVAIDGAVFSHAVRLLGNDILKSLTTEQLGPGSEQEGAAIQDKSLCGGTPFKITGEFIVQGAASRFRTGPPPAARDEAIEKADIALFPGAFKPPHIGHKFIVDELAKVAKKVLVLISVPVKEARTLPSGKELTPDESRDIWNMYIDDPRVVIDFSPKASPITAVMDYIGEDSTLPENSSVLLGCSVKGSDPQRYATVGRYARGDLSIGVSPCAVLQHGSEYMQLLDENAHIKDSLPSSENPKKDPKDFHAADMRHLAELSASDPIAEELFSDFIPNGVPHEVVLGLLGVEKKTPIFSQSGVGEEGEADLNEIYDIIKDIFDSKKDESVMEMSTGGGGGAGGVGSAEGGGGYPALAWPGMGSLKKAKKKRGSKKKKSKLSEAQKNMSLEKLSGGFGIPRNVMPKIRKGFMPDFLEYINEQGLGHKLDRVEVNKLMPLQHAVDRFYVDKIKRNFTGRQLASHHPILISSDNNILDGHHRWCALKEMSPESKMTVLILDMPHEAAMDMMKKYPESEYHVENSQNT